MREDSNKYSLSLSPYTKKRKSNKKNSQRPNEKPKLINKRNQIYQCKQELEKEQKNYNPNKT